MSLLRFWETARDTIVDKHVHQVIAIAGNGKLVDNNATSNEFREYLSYIPSSVLITYAEECLNNSFEQSGFALQDVVNEIGKRLSFEITSGLYRGKRGEIGFDGIWRSGGRDIVVEVKTTDAYRLNLDTLAQYRSELISHEQISFDKSSILIIVGRQDTGDLEAQIRGSRHAWDIRLISVEALAKLMKTKENIEGENIIGKIRDILIPQEFTRVDGIVDLVFSTSEDVKISDSIDKIDEEIEDTSYSEKLTPVSFHNECIIRISAELKTPLTKQSRTTYISPDQNLVVSCAVSKMYPIKQGSRFWFAFHPAQQSQLEKVNTAFAAFGCGSSQYVFVFPRELLLSWLEGLNQTFLENGGNYWHVLILQKPNGKWVLQRKTGFNEIDIQQYLL